MSHVGISGGLLRKVSAMTVGRETGTCGGPVNGGRGRPDS